MTSLFHDRLGPGIEIAPASRRIAGESLVAGIGLSVLGMVAAAYGHLTPVQGVLLQELIGVAVILNALRIAPHEPAMKTEAVSSGQARIAQGATP